MGAVAFSMGGEREGVEKLFTRVSSWAFLLSLAAAGLSIPDTPAVAQDAPSMTELEKYLIIGNKSSTEAGDNV